MCTPQTHKNIFRTIISQPLAVLLVFFSGTAYGQVSELTVEVNWVSWASDNKVEVYDPNGTLIFEVCDPSNCQTTASNSSYSATFNLGCYANLNNYYFIALDAFGDGWNGNGNYVRITSGGVQVANYNLTSGSSSGQQFFNVSGGGSCPTDDASMESVSGVISGCELSSSEQIKVIVRNQGTTSITNLPIQYQVNGGGYISAGQIGGPILAGDTAHFTFNVNLSSYSTYSIDVRAQLSGDANTANDAINGYLVTNAQTHDFVNMGALTMGFEASEDLSGWSTLNVNGDAGVWSFTNTTNPRTGSRAAAYNYSTANAADDWMFTPCLELEAGATYELTYYYRVRSATYPESFTVRVTSAQDDLSTVSTLQTFNNITNTTYLLATNNITVGTTGTYYVAWEATSAADRWDINIDDIQIQKIVPIDVGVVSVNSPTDGCGLSSSETVQITIENFGTSSATNIPVQYNLNGGGYQSAGTYTGTIASGATAVYSFAANLSAAQTHTIDVRTQLSGDGIAANDEFAGYSVTNQSANLAQGVITMGFEASEDLSDWLIINANGDARQWEQSTQAPRSGSQNARLRNTTTAANDWLFTGCIYLETGETYLLDYSFRARNAGFTENMTVYLTSAQTTASVVQTLATYTGFSNTAYQDESIEFTVSSSATYYVAWRGQSAANQRGIHLDDVRIYNKTTFWLGYTSDWSDAANWSGGIPTLSSAAEIPTSPIGGNMPTISGSVDAGDLSINPGATISFASSATLNVYGDYTGTSTYNNGRISFVGSSSQIISGANSFYELEINNSNGVQIGSGDQYIREALFLEDGQLDLNSNALVILSDALGDARIAPVNAGSILGNVTVQRYIDAGETNWRFLCSPVQGADFEQWDDDFVTSGFIGSDWPNFPFTSISAYDESVPGDNNYGWVPLVNSNQPITPGEGFWVWCGDNSAGTAPFTIDVTGPILVGAVDLNVSHTNSGDSINDGWTMVGNPYASEIDWDAAGWIKTNVNDAIYIFDPDAGVYSSYVGGVGTNGGSRYIASSQAFWVHSNGSDPVLTSAESVKSNNGQGFLDPEEIDKSPLLRFTLISQTATDDMVIRFKEGGTQRLDSELDAEKFYSYESGVLNLVSFSSDSLAYSINSQPSLTADVSIPIQTLVQTSKTYRLEFTEILNFEPTSCLFLEDLETGDMIDIKSIKYVDVFLTANQQTPRFVLHATAPLSKVVSDVTCSGKDDGVVSFSSPQSGNWLFELRDDQQSTIGSKSFTGQGKVQFGNLLPGHYFINVISDGLCSAMRDSFNIHEPEQVIASFNALVVDDQEVQFSNQSNGASRYVWKFGDGQESTLKNPTHQFGLGEFVVEMTAFNVNNCSNTARTSLNFKEALGVSNQANEQGPKVWSDGKNLWMNFNFSKSESVDLKLFDSSGKLAYSNSAIVVQSYTKQINLERLAAGIYVVQLSWSESNYTTQVFLR
ncbi:MAG: choice-of-anchor J domain-containing protein [Flavobacteriales bacterium]